MKRFPDISIDPFLYIALPFAALIFPLRLVLSWIIAALVHEVGHICAVFAFGASIHSIRIGIGGATIKVPPLGFLQELICVAAGPAFGCLLILFAKFLPMVALCAFIQTMYNLLPLPGNDGERILKNTVALIAPHYAEQITVSFRWLCIILLMGLCVYLYRWSPAFLPVGAIILMKHIKIPCKHAQQIVQ